MFANWFSIGWGRGIMFANWFVSPLVGGYACYWVCLFVGWWLCDCIISLTLGMVSGLEFFYYRFKAIPWILSYKWADYWPYLEFIYHIFFYVVFCCYVYYHGLFVSCLGWGVCWAFCCIVFGIFGWP